MNREVKFRAWFQPKGIMEYLMPMEPCTSQGNHICFGCEERGHRFYDCLNPDDWQVMQSTGLRDINGKEVWEGDVVTWKDGSDDSSHWRYAQVRWYAPRGKWCFILVKKSGGLDAGYTFGGDISFGGYDEIEVIGDVFENPELLTP